jgi:hypothetical protein
MGTNMAMKRAAKAKRRKAIIDQKRKVEVFAASLREKVRRAAAAPIQLCLLSNGLIESGMGTMVLARGTDPEHFNCANFLLDTFCRGVKDAHFKILSKDILQDYMDTLSWAHGLEPVDPSYGRKLLRDLVAWARGIGFSPARDFAAVEALFGDVNADACDVTFKFGLDGKPTYIQGPYDSPAEALRCIKMVHAFEEALKDAA